MFGCAGVVPHPFHVGLSADLDWQSCVSALASLGAVPSVVPCRVHQISTKWRDSEMTAKNNQPELIEKLTDGICNLTPIFQDTF